MTLPNRVFRSPLMMGAFYTDGTSLHLIKLIKPYANGKTYAIHSNANPSDNGMYKTEEKAIKQFNKLIDHSKLREEIWKRKI